MSAHADDFEFARVMLPQVSRTFAPAIDVLPGPLADPVRLSYLLCRVADTIEDTHRIVPLMRNRWLIRFAASLADPVDTGEALADEIAIAIDQDTPDVQLVTGLPRLLRLLRTTEPAIAGRVIHWSRELSLGMARFVLLEEDSRDWTALGTLDDLEAYEYYVAGTVGCLLNDLIRGHLGTEDPDERQARLAVSFGLGLQGTNIIQDLADDRARGWSYLPEEVARRHGTSTRRMADLDQRAAATAAILEMAERAARNLDDGLEFVMLLPRRAPRIRLFCLWPLLLALRTLVRIVSSEEVVERRVRIARSEVRELTREALSVCLSNTALRKLYDRERLLFVAAVQSNTTY